MGRTQQDACNMGHMQHGTHATWDGHNMGRTQHGTHTTWDTACSVLHGGRAGAAALMSRGTSLQGTQEPMPHHGVGP